MVVTLPASASRSRHGDVADVSMAVPGRQCAEDFYYGGVLGRRFSPGSVEQGWQVGNATPMPAWQAARSPARTVAASPAW